jgi:hypothetical protein
LFQRKVKHISKTVAKAGLGWNWPTDSIPLSSIIWFNNSLYASVGDRREETGRSRGGILRSSDEGLTWLRSDNGIDLGSPTSDLCHYNGVIYASAGLNKKMDMLGFISL